MSNARSTPTPAQGSAGGASSRAPFAHLLRATIPPLPAETGTEIEFAIDARSWQHGRAGLLGSTSPFPSDVELLDNLDFERRFRRALEPEATP